MKSLFATAIYIFEKTKVKRISNPSRKTSTIILYGLNIEIGFFGYGKSFYRIIAF